MTTSTLEGWGRAHAANACVLSVVPLVAVIYFCDEQRVAAAGGAGRRVSVVSR